MNRYLFLAAMVIGTFSGVSAQTVVVTAAKTVYTRPKPMADFKKTFTVTNPKVKAATPALSRKIESTLSYSKVLGLDIREELTELQWLEEADFKVDFNARGILVVTLWMYGSGAYPDGTTKTVVVNLRTGSRIAAAEAFTNTTELIDRINKKQKLEIGKAIEDLQKDPEQKESNPGELFAGKSFSVEDLNHFAVDDAGIMFIYDYGFPHVVKALEPDGHYKFTWNEIAAFVKTPGPLSEFISK